MAQRKEADHKKGARERRRDDGSIFAYEVRYRAHGRSRSKSFAVRAHGTEAKARDAAISFLRREREALRAGSWIDPKAGEATLEDVFEDYLTSIRGNGKPLAPRTVAWYRSLWDAHIAPRPQLARKPIGKVKRLDIRHLVDGMTDHFTLDDKRDGSASIHAVLRMLRAVFAQAARDERIPAGANPPRDLRAPKPKTREPRTLTREELDAIAAQVPDRYRALVLVLGRCGLRIGEAAALRVSDVDELRRQIHVSRSAGEVRGRGWEEGPTKTGRVRAVPIPRYVLDVVLEHIESYAGGETSFLFTSEAGDVLRPNNWRKRIWYPACTRARSAGLLDAERALPHPHDLRHSAAILAMEDGVPPRVVQEILGHSTYRVTMEIYARKASEELLAQAAEAMDAAHASGARRSVDAPSRDGLSG